MDYQVVDHGSIIMVLPISAKARKWVHHNVEAEPWQWVGGGFAVDRHYAESLIAGMTEAGLKGARP